MGLEEIWKPIKGYEDRYLISNFGKVKSLYTNNIMCTFKNKDGYERVTLQKNGSQFKPAVHRLVAEAFIPNPNNLPEVDHIDCNPQNNNVSNLRWISREDNLERSFDLKHQTKNKKPVQQFTLDGQLIATYESVNKAFRQTNVRHISEAAREKRKTAGGYIWKYLNERSDDLSDSITEL